MYFDIINLYLEKINDFLYSNILVFCLIASGIFFTFYLNFIQLHIFKAIKILKVNSKNKSKITTSYEAFIITSGARIGIGNIVGVSLAVLTGGKGAIFWMWVCAFLGGASAFAESTLAQVYKQKTKNGFLGGVAFYIFYGLNLKYLAFIFASCLILADLVGFNALLGYSINANFTNYFNFSSLISGIIITIIAFFIFLKGVAFSKKLVPFMIITYFALAFYVFIKYFDFNLILEIFKQAFDFSSISGGILGSAIVIGAKRGLFSNEAGMGSAPNAAAMADVKYPAEQGLVQSLSVLLDLLVCSASAIFVIFSPIKEADAQLFITKAFTYYFGDFGQYLIIFFITIFGLTSFYGNYFYSKINLLFITKNKKILLIFNIFAVFFVFLGTQAKLSFVWNLADFLMFFTCIINLFAIFSLRKIVKQEKTKPCFESRKK